MRNDLCLVGVNYLQNPYQPYAHDIRLKYWIGTLQAYFIVQSIINLTQATL